MPRYSRTVKNEWAATLAGDLAQTALLRRKGEKYVGPSSYFNSSLCPRGIMNGTDIL